MTELTARELLVHLYETAIDAVDGRLLVQQWCRENPSANFSHCVAIGKAAPAMLQGALDSCHTLNSALLIMRRGDAPRALKRNNKVLVVESAHPVPDQSSLDAGDALLKYLAEVPDQSSLLVLISGGTSSLVEVPEEGITLAQLQQINDYLLASGKDIQAMNAWRKRFSRIKGGGLLRYVQHLQCTQLLVSDVKGDDPAVIGSGLLVQSDHSEHDGDEQLLAMLPKASGQAHKCAPIDTVVIGTSAKAQRAAAAEAEHQGLEACLHESFVCGDAVEQGRVLGGYLRGAARGVHIWGGETTVRLPETPGLGGRNQSLALSLAAAIDGIDDLSVLVAGTDGIDGNTPCAGAVVSGRSLQQIRQMGFDVDRELARANAGTVLMATGELFQPGPTNTNVMDVVIAFKRS
jgi:glycerate 2-kinase